MNESRLSARMPLFVSLILLTASVRAKLLVMKPTAWVPIADSFTKGLIVSGGALAGDGAATTANSGDSSSSSSALFADEDDGDDEEVASGDGSAAAAAAAAAAGAGGGAAAAPSSPLVKFRQAAVTLRAHGHPSDCEALAAFEEAVEEGADTPEPEVLARWLDVRVAMAAPVKDNSTVYARNLHMVALEAEAYRDGGRIGDGAVEALHKKLAKELGVKEGAFKESLAEFEKTMQGQVADTGKKIVDAMLKVLHDPDFVAKAQKSMDERESRARDFLGSAEAIEKTRLEFLEALEGAGKQDPLAATQLAMKLKPTLEVLLGPGAL